MKLLPVSYFDDVQRLSIIGGNFPNGVLSSDIEVSDVAPLAAGKRRPIRQPEYVGVSAVRVVIACRYACGRWPPAPGTSGTRLSLSNH